MILTDKIIIGLNTINNIRNENGKSELDGFSDEADKCYRKRTILINDIFDIKENFKNKYGINYINLKINLQEDRISYHLDADKLDTLKLINDISDIKENFKTKHGVKCINLKIKLREDSISYHLDEDKLDISSPMQIKTKYILTTEGETLKLTDNIDKDPILINSDTTSESSKLLIIKRKKYLEMLGNEIKKRILSDNPAPVYNGDANNNINNDVNNKAKRSKNRM